MSLADDKQKAESEFFDYVAESYRCFLAGDDDRCEEVDNAKATEFEQRAEEIKKENQLIEEVSKLILATATPRDIPQL